MRHKSIFLTLMSGLSLGKTAFTHSTVLILISLPFVSPYPTLLSLNRFEGKKNAMLALKAFALIKNEHSNLRLVLAGIFFCHGYNLTPLTSS
jgi:glycosyltransferase involved in cell wall biosynthesis